MFQTKVVEEHKTYILGRITFPPKIVPLRDTQSLHTAQSFLGS